MEERTDDVPLPPLRLKVTIVYNGKGSAAGAAADADAEYDTPETVAAIAGALEAGGCRVSDLIVDENLAEQLKKARPDIVFNIAEGVRGRGREAEVPALLNLLGIPFTGSDETALSVSLDKALCKRVVASYGIKVPQSIVISCIDDLENISLSYPIIVKPNSEGSSKGVGEACVVEDAFALRALAEKNLKLYREPMLCEEYLPGREFTVGLLGNGSETKVFQPMEIAFRRATQGEYRVYSFGVKQNYKEYISYSCPASITQKQSDEMQQAALGVFNALGCQDCARVDFRMDAAGTPHFIEINPLPGLAPGYSDFPMLAEFCGMSYQALVCGILKAALRRLKAEAEK